MFDLTTILTLLAPAVIAPLGCLAILKAIGRAESRRAGRASAPIEITARRQAGAGSVQIVPDAAAAPAPVEVVVERTTAPIGEADRERQVA